MLGVFFFFFQAEDGIRDVAVTGVQTCALPIWILIDAVAHPSGDVSLLSLREDPTSDYPLRAMISRFGPGGAVADLELLRLPPPSGTEPPPTFMASLDRARIVAHGEDPFAAVASTEDVLAN